MAVLKEYVCAAHGEFEAFDAVCPYGCSSRFVKREIRTAPAIRHTGTRNTDNLSRQLAQDFNLPDISTRDGDSVMTNLRKKNWTELKGQPPSVWAGGVPHADPGWTQRGEKAPTFDPRAAGMASGASLRQNQAGAVVVDSGRGSAPIPKPRASILKDNKGQPMAYRAPLPEVD